MMGDVPPTIARSACSMDCCPLIIEFKLAVMRSEGRDSIGSTYCVRSLAPLAAARALNPPTSSSLGDERRVPSLLLSTAGRDPRSVPLLAPLGGADCRLKPWQLLWTWLA